MYVLENKGGIYMMKRLRFIAIVLVLGMACLIAPEITPTIANETIATSDKLIVFKINDTNYYTQTIGSENIAVNQMDTAPIIHLDRTFVPVRFLGNALGVSDSNIEWNSATRTATLKGSNKLDLTIGKSAITVNGVSEEIDVAPMISNSRTMLPARYVAEGLGFTVDWDADNQLVIVYQGKKPDLSNIIAKIKGDKPVTSSIGEIVGGKLTQEQAKQLQSNIHNRASAAKYEWIEWAENDPTHLEFKKAIEAEMKKVGLTPVAIDNKMFAEDRRGVGQYFVVATDNQVWAVQTKTLLGGRIDAAVMYPILKSL